MTDASNSPASSDIVEQVKALTEEKEAVDDKLVERAEKLHHKAGELVATAREKKVVDDKLAETHAEQLNLKNQELEETNKHIVGRELKMIEQKEEIKALKETPPK